MQDHATNATPCLSEEDLLELVAAGSLSEQPALEAHLADCATCSTLVAAIVERSSAQTWNALAGTQLGRYRLDTQIGAGGMGAVYRAHDTKLDRAIAIKILHDRSHAERLASEARAAASVGHPAIVAIHDVGAADGVAYVAMELVDGESLRSVIDRGPLPIARVRELATELASALAAAHARGVIHRDLKPENLVLARDGRLRVLDFGLARFAGIEPLDRSEAGAVQGTAGYMAPEQARGESADARADLFALGAIAYELATGQRAFPGATHAERLTAVLRDTPPLDGLGALAPVVARCLAKDPDARFHSASDLAWTLSAAPEQTSAQARTSRRAILVGAGAAALVGIGGLFIGRRRSSPTTLRSEFRQLTFKTGRVSSARFMPDGQRLVFGAAWDADPLRGFVADLGSGRTNALDLDGDVLAVSRQGDIAASLGRRFTNHQSATGRLAIVPLAGGRAPRIVAEDVQEADFASDEALAIIRATPEGFTLELPSGTALTTSRTWITHARISPDGRHIAYIEHPNVNDDAGDLVVIDVASRTQRTLSAGWSSIAGLAWHPRGDSIWFTAGRDNANNAAHAVTLDARVRTIAETTGRLRLHDLAAGDRAVVSVDAWRLRTIVGGSELVDRDCSLSEASYVTDVSADGSTLAVAELGDADAAVGAYLVPIDGRPPLRLGPGFPLAISPSGQRIAAKIDGTLVMYSTANGDRATIAAPGVVSAARWIDEGSLIAISQQRVWRLGIGQSPQALTEAGVAGSLAVDRARARCAVIDAAGAVHVIDLASRTSRIVAGTFARRQLCGWLAEPNAILAATSTTPLDVIRIDPETGATSPHRTLEPPRVGLKAVDTLVIHPSGTRYAYSYGQELSQLYLMSPVRA